MPTNQHKKYNFISFSFLFTIRDLNTNQNILWSDARSESHEKFSILQKEKRNFETHLISFTHVIIFIWQCQEILMKKDLCDNSSLKLLILFSSDRHKFYLFIFIFVVCKTFSSFYWLYRISGAKCFSFLFLSFSHKYLWW